MLHSVSGFSLCLHIKYHFSRFISFYCLDYDVGAHSTTYFSFIISYLYHFHVGVSDSWLHNCEIKRLGKLDHNKYKHLWAQIYESVISNFEQCRLAKKAYTVFLALIRYKTGIYREKK